VEARLKEYGVSVASLESTDADETGASRRRPSTRRNRLLAGFGLGERLAKALTAADISLTVVEFALIIAGLAVVGFALGTIRFDARLGVVVGVVLGFLPMLYLRRAQNRRRRAITAQLPDMLTTLTGALRAGYGLTQSLEVLSDQLPAPISEEFARVLRDVGLGLPVSVALEEMAQRVASDDMDLIVTAIVVQHDMGGNLARTLESIGHTVRDRIRILREIRVLTSQQRLTGYILAAMPPIMALLLFVVNPEYMSGLFEPGMTQLLPVAAVIMQVIGFLIIRKIVDIEV
jgi:tight adherence protein B